MRARFEHACKHDLAAEMHEDNWQVVGGVLLECFVAVDDL